MNYISLGHFCSVALELEKFGLRTESSPFDWLISDFESVISAIETHFDDFLNYDHLSQDKKLHYLYYDSKYKCSFHHDFDKYAPLKKQLPVVQSKYARRINRFYKTIQEPTLFIRYISSKQNEEGKSKELVWIEENYDRIISLLKSFNKDNDILFIANEDVTSEMLTIYNVEKDENDSVARQPFCKSPVLFEMFSSIDFPNKEANIARYNKKYSKINKVPRKIKAILKKIFLKEYIHDVQF